MMIRSIASGMFGLIARGFWMSTLRTFSSVEKSVSPWNRRSPVRHS